MSFLLSLLSIKTLSAQVNQSPTPSVCQIPITSPLAAGGQLTNPCNPPPNPTPTPTPIPTPTPVTGRVGPKYVVLTVTYAPPGSGSSVTYSNSTMLGTSLSFNNSFMNTVSTTTTVNTGFKIFGIGFGGSSSTTTQFTQEEDTSSSVAVNQTTTLSTTIPGPSSSAVGLNHDVDLIWLWLNPVLDFTANSSNSITWTGFEYDLRDPAGDMDVIAVPVEFLNGHQAMPANIADVLARRWASRIVCTIGTAGCDANGTADPGLNASDFAAILTADPFANPSYVINIPAGSTCTADGRFCRTTNQDLLYSPPPAGGQPTTETFSVIHQTTATQGQGASDTRQVGFSGDLNGSLGITITKDFSLSFGADLKNGSTLVSTNKWNAMSSQQVGQTASVTVKGPSTADNYTGPVEFEVYQDNIYGTFMFGFIPAPTYNVFASPTSQSVIQGSCTSYTASISALVSGFNSTVSFSLGSGLPANATASFSPTSVSGAGSSVMTVCTNSSTPVGTNTLTINATSGIEVHSTSVSLTVNAPPPPPQPADFSISASPSSQTVTAGNSGFATVTISPLNGFTGNVTLSTSADAGLIASLSKTSIAGSGSATLTVNTQSFLSTGTYVVQVTGVSGNLTHTTNVFINVNSSTNCGSRIICQIP
ncbi:MAG TPA: hypothetical protein VGJ33_01545 [Candidatus Angelobacter sp.]